MQVSRAAFLRTLAILGLCTGLSGPAVADGFYGGGGLSYSTAMTSADTIGYREAEDQYPMLGLVAGYEWDLGGVGLAAEISGDFALGSDFVETSLNVACDNGAQGTYFCTHDATLRLRAVAAFDLDNGYTFLGSAGYGMIWGDASTSPLNRGPASSSGYTVGVGLERASANGLTHRVELIYDNFDTIRSTSGGGSGNNRGFEAVTLSYRILFGR